MAQNQPRHLDSWTRIWLGAAAMWSLGLVAAGLFVNSYSTSNSLGETPGETLIQVNGVKALIPLLIPLAGVVIVTLALWHKSRVLIQGVGVLVWAVFSLLALLVVLGALTIGPFVAPVAVFTLLAINRARGRSQVLTSVTS